MYRLSRLAGDDFASIFEYTWVEFGPRQADAYTDELEKTLQLLSSSLLVSHECPEIAASIRRHDHQRHAIFYRHRDEGIFVIRILHQKMDIQNQIFNFEQY
ncbi:type II toxin-antitoxin system RelE/ParE family toxin [Salinisphaera sp. RV14]|uniref:type II toxin-antitoxin system RelE/ParE family toxin n=1 Tax=unclassified Salinisphaera TaxID=2649847 RepID=UPI003F8417B7